MRGLFGKSFLNKNNRKYDIETNGFEIDLSFTNESGKMVWVEIES
jgi:hypothetical protein